MSEEAKPQVPVVFLGGPYDGWRGHMNTETPPERVQLGQAEGYETPRATYERVDDPDTGEWLGGYVIVTESVIVWSETGRFSGDEYQRGRIRRPA